MRPILNTAVLLAHYCVRNRRDDLRPLSDWRLEGDFDLRVFLSNRVRQARQVFLDVPARTEKHRHDPESLNALAEERGDAILERRLHQFKKGERHALAGDLLGEL